MAVAFDTSATTIVANLTVNVNITIAAGSNLALAVCTTNFDGGSVSSVTGAGATWAASALGTTTGSGRKDEIWFGTNPSTGAQTVTVTMASGASENMARVFAFSGVNQTTPGANYQGSAVTQAQTITTVNGDGAVSSIRLSGSRATITGCTTTIDQDNAGSLFYMGTHCLASGASVAFTWTGGTGFEVVQGCSVQQVSVGFAQNILLARYP